VTLLDFDDGLPPGSQVSLNALNLGIVTGTAVDVGASVVTAANVGAVLLAANQNVRYVTKQGNDATGTGSEAQPFLTIAAAIASITTASSAQPFKIDVGPGVYTTAFVMQPWIFIVGAGRNLTVLQNASANWVGAGFATAGSQIGGFVECTLQTNALVVDLSAMSTLAQFFLYDSNLDGNNVTITGGASTQRFTAQNIQQINGAVLNWTVTNIPLTMSDVDLNTMNLNLTNTAAFTMNTRLLGVHGLRPITATCNDTTNFLNVIAYYHSTISSYIVIVGSGVSLLARALVFPIVLPDADATISFTTPLVAGAVVAANEGDNLFAMTPTANRTITIGNCSPGTRIRIVNNSNLFMLLLAGTFGGIQSYVPPAGFYEAYRDSGVLSLMSTNMPQYGNGVLVNGVSVLIAADVAARSTIHVIATNLNASAAIGVLVVLDADRVIGSFAGGGGFVVRSLTLAGAAVATDQSSFRWIVVRGN